ASSPGSSISLIVCGGRTQRSNWWPVHCGRWAPADRARPRSNVPSTSGDGPARLSRCCPRQRPTLRSMRTRWWRPPSGSARANGPRIMCGGGAQAAAAEITELPTMLRAPVLGYRGGRGLLDSRAPLSVTLPLGHELWAQADVVLAVGTRLLMQLRQWGIDENL